MDYFGFALMVSVLPCALVDGEFAWATAFITGAFVFASDIAKAAAMGGAA